LAHIDGVVKLSRPKRSIKETFFSRSRKRKKLRSGRTH